MHKISFPAGNLLYTLLRKVITLIPDSILIHIPSELEPKKVVLVHQTIQEGGTLGSGHETVSGSLYLETEKPVSIVYIVTWRFSREHLDNSLE